jgi:hypothetical protein
MRRRGASPDEDLIRKLDRLLGRDPSPAVRRALRERARHRRSGHPGIDDTAALAYMAEIIALTGCPIWSAAFAVGGGYGSAAHRLRRKFLKAPGKVRRSLMIGVRGNAARMAQNGMDPSAASLGALAIVLSRAADIRQIIRYPSCLRAYENNRRNLYTDMIQNYFVQNR